jgi:hypothetical protein
MKTKGFLTIILLTGIMLSFSYQGQSQTNNQASRSYESYLVKETNPIVLQYADPGFPQTQFVIGQKNDQMEEYAKLHQPFALQKNTGDPVNDQAKFEADVALWLQYNPYYPQFVPYHVYNYLLTAEDDIKIYEAAKAAWSKANPEKFQQIQNASK